MGGKKEYARIVTQIERLQQGLQEISMHKAMLQSGNPLQTNESTYVKKLIVGMNSIRDGEFFKPEKQEQPQERLEQEDFLSSVPPEMVKAGRAKGLDDIEIMTYYREWLEKYGK